MLKRNLKIKYFKVKHTIIMTFSGRSTSMFQNGIVLHDFKDIKGELTSSVAACRSYQRLFTADILMKEAVNEKR